MQLTLMMFFLLFQQNPATELELSYNNNARIIFIEVVETNIGYDTLISNAADITRKDGENTGTGMVFTKQSSFMLYSKKLTKVPDGKLKYNLQIEVKDSKYRCIISDMVFYEYERSRYGRFVEKRNGERPVEVMLKEPSKVWKSHKESMLENFEKVIENIKNRMAMIPEMKDNDITVKLNDDW